MIPRQRRDQGIPSREAEVGGVHDTVDQEATLHADLDTLCTAVYCTADDLLPERPGNARRRVTDAEVVTLCVAQAIMGMPSDRRFLAVARKRLWHLFPQLLGRLSQAPPPAVGHDRVAHRDLRLGEPRRRGLRRPARLDPVECGRSRETAKRSAPGDAAAYGYCRSHERAARTPELVVERD